MISLVIPTLNEAENIEPLVARLAQCQPRLDEVIFVDDGSTDGTRERIRSLSADASIRLIERETPALGLSGAVIAGASAAAGDWLVVMDADLSHPPEKIAELMRPLLEDRADIVIGSRYVRGGSTPGWPLWRRILSRSAAGLAYPLTGVHDSMCGFFALPRKLLLELTPAATGFKIAFEALVHGGKNLRVLEIPIVFRDRTRGVSKMSFGVAVLFAFRWIAAMTKTLSGRQETATRFSRQSSTESPTKRSKVANNVLP
ncbi:MAG TPA: polyprenol monophosphomannose synthase [Chthoniobacterales bacterium]|nr:polyprenol monophosphomannose synthase [Chthoniobacterales bacterium]